MATHQSLGDLSRATPIESVPSDDHPSAHLVPEKISSQRETQNNRAGKLISSSSSTLATQASASNTVKAGDNSSPNTQLQHRREDSMDTATWLYYLVFSEGQMPAVTRDSALTVSGTKHADQKGSLANNHTGGETGYYSRRIKVSATYGV